MVIVKRYVDESKMAKLKPPILVYGRRKTGKTFFVKSTFRDAIYLFVRRDRSIYYESRGELIGYDEMKRLVEERDERIVVIDEFHRLPEDFLEWIHMKSPKNLVLVTSTLHLAKRLIGKGSPILGLFLDYQMRLIDERDILVNLSEKIGNPRELIENAVYMREPILLRWFGGGLVEILKNLRYVVPSLVGEIFTEEEKELSKRYEGILRALSSGKSTLSEISAYLYSNRLIDRQDISSIKPYMKTLIDIGTVERIPEYSGKRYYYFIHSPMIDLYYYLDEKYNLSETELEDRYFIEKFPVHVEQFFRGLIAKVLGMRAFMIRKPDVEINLAFADHKKLKVVGEVKWKGNVGRGEIRKMEEKFSRYRSCKKILVVQSEDCLDFEPRSIEVWDVKRIVNMVRESSK
ncbi:MAG TPA: ATP-binding protein [Thermoplasmatales archaeon]|nr:ATP-binding protein [Thermoplasmatales archaeon]